VLLPIYHFFTKLPGCYHGTTGPQRFRSTAGTGSSTNSTVLVLDGTSTTTAGVVGGSAAAAGVPRAAAQSAGGWPMITSPKLLFYP
jgi:hypothetical protein